MRRASKRGLPFYCFCCYANLEHCISARYPLTTLITFQDGPQGRYVAAPSSHPRSAADLVADRFPSSEAFDAINDALNASDADRKDALKQGGAVFAFTLKNSKGETESWNIDLKESGKVSKGLGQKPNGKRRDSTVSSSRCH
jgi:hypothetical protein